MVCLLSVWYQAITWKNVDLNRQCWPKSMNKYGVIRPQRVHMRICVPETVLEGRDTYLHPTDTVGCNYLFLPSFPSFWYTSLYLNVYVEQSDVQCGWFSHASSKQPCLPVCHWEWGYYTAQCYLGNILAKDYQTKGIHNPLCSMVIICLLSVHKIYPLARPSVSLSALFVSWTIQNGEKYHKIQWAI